MVFSELFMLLPVTDRGRDNRTFALDIQLTAKIFFRNARLRDPFLEGAGYGLLGIVHVSHR